MKVIILCGLPGSGKSTYAMCNTETTYIGLDSKCSYINQDKLVSRQACVKAFKDIVEFKPNEIVIDRTNISKAQRKIWIDLAKSYKADSIECVYLHVDKDECVKRICDRKNHPTILESDSFEKKQAIVYSFYDDLELPSLDEGFNKVTFIRNY